MTKHAKDIELEPIDRFAFYEEARSCFAVVQVMEVRCCTSPPPPLYARYAHAALLGVG